MKPSFLLRALLLAALTFEVSAAPAPLGVAPKTGATRLTPQRAVTGQNSPHRPATGEIEVVVQLSDAPLAAAQAAALAQKKSLTSAQRRALVASIRAQQTAVLPGLRALGGREIGRLHHALNAVVIAVDADRLLQIRQLPGVRSARSVRDYRLALSETVPYVGGSAVQSLGFKGEGQRIAVLDSGIDYTHVAFGGAGTEAAYMAAYGSATSDARNRQRDGLFPTAKVVAGYDFVGEQWPAAARSEDPDPIDSQGHGTHVADIAAGNLGMAPAAKLLAVKVCSAVSTSCNGVALLLGVEYALDPDGDDDIADAADVVNLSIGSDYGQQEDDLSEALSNVVDLGITVVTAGGNAGNRPYIASSPGNAPKVISVAQTTVPRSRGFLLKVDSPPAYAGLYRNTQLVDWAPLDTVITGTLKRPPIVDGAVSLACQPLPAGWFSGHIALIDRGSCDFSSKVNYAALAGAMAVIIVNNVPGEAPGLGQGNIGEIVPTIAVGQEVGQQLKAAIASGPTVVTLDPASVISLAGSVVNTSSRGPSFSLNAIKPDLGAPGGSISAVAGGGRDTSAFSGTSGAAPVVSGAAALVQQVHPTNAPFEIKARLVNTAETLIYTNPVLLPGELAPITRIGGGEVRVDRAVATLTIAWEQGDARLPSLSFGYQAVSAGERTLTKTLVVKNFAATSRTYSLANGFRYANDQASGAVKIAVTPATLTVRANGTATATVTLTLAPTLLPAWTLNGGSAGGDGARLQTFEYDGYITISDALDRIHVPWHVLPHRAAAVRASTRKVTLANGTGRVTLTNAAGATAGRYDAFSLIGTSPRTFTGNLPAPGDNYAVVDLQALGIRIADMGGVFLGSRYAVEFALSAYDARAHPLYPGGYELQIDTNNDGTDDYAVYTQESIDFGASGVSLTVVVSLTDPAAVPMAYFYTDADLNSSSSILPVPAGALGVVDVDAGKDLHRRWRITALAYDNYFTGAITDVIADAAYTPGTPRYTVIPASGSVPVGGSQVLTLAAPAQGAQRSPAQTGVLLLYRDARAKQEAEVITVTP